ncbi:MAG TPA: T9SS type A sorting domain-containing protein [Puia sp.]|nr:T9SS type A sorting domain-containing protein [Puia sp.]
MKSILTISTLFILLAPGSFAQVQTAGSYLDISQPAGGAIQNGDILEIRGIISVPSGTTVTGLTYTSTVPANTAYQAGTLRAETNEGVIVGGISNTGTYTDAAGDDQGQIVGSAVTIYMGTGASSAAGGSLVGGTTTPVFYNAQSILMAAYRVKVTGSVGSTFTVVGTISYSIGGVPTAATLTSIVVGVYTNTSCSGSGPTNYMTSETNGTFGSGSTQNRSTSSANVTGFTFVNLSAGQPADGNYSIVNNNSPTQYTGTTPAAGDRVFGVWDVIGDHTGSTTGTGNPPAANGVNAGYMLAVNGTYAPSSFFSTTVNGLTANTEYTLSFWVYNLCPLCGANPSTGGASGTPGVKPNIAFAIAGMDYYNTGELAYSGQWVEGSFTFNSGAGTSVPISIRNNAPGGGGNDFAIDDITLTTCLILLPVDLLSFKGAPEPGGVALTWQTAGDQDAADFVVERSAGNDQFDSIGRVEGHSQGGGGGDYHFTDHSIPPANGAIYRLRIIGIDGNTSYSPLVSVAGEAITAQTFRVGPNPAFNSATLYMEAAEAGPVEVSLWNLAGERVGEQTCVVAKGQNAVALQSINRLAKGIYVIRMVSGLRTECTKLLVE